MKKVVKADLFMEPISIVNNLPNTCNKPEARRLGAKHVSDDQHEEILDEIAHCAASARSKPTLGAPQSTCTVYPQTFAW
jgi:hypothetical protein